MNFNFILHAGTWMSCPEIYFCYVQVYRNSHLWILLYFLEYNIVAYKVIKSSGLARQLYSLGHGRLRLQDFAVFTLLPLHFFILYKY